MAFNLDDYEPVAARLQRWIEMDRGGESVPAVRTYLVSDPLSDICVFRAELWELGLDGRKDMLVATGWAEEVRNAGNVNRTSHVENCETSAVGRALANAGYAGSDVNKRPSREEMSKVQRMTTGTDKRMPEVKVTQPAGTLTEAQERAIRAICKANGRTVPSNLQSMSKQDASALIDALKKGEEPDAAKAPEEPF